ncbi:MAG TPA: hypothetical protein DDW21_10405 [Verrucomicrobiales bacterium]|nr:MAG: hypothetical protein CAK88_03925 [Verrucomicrobiae bacterium AMD-G2]HBE23815.1 hypothetical protein [Verrucomicrobiales bacterium]
MPLPDDPQKSPWDDFTPYQGKPARDFPLFLHGIFVFLCYAIPFGIASLLSALVMYAIYYKKTSYYRASYVFGEYHSPSTKIAFLSFGALTGAYLLARWFCKHPLAKIGNAAPPKPQQPHRARELFFRCTDLLLCCIVGGLAGLMFFYIGIGKRSYVWYPFADIHTPMRDQASIILGAIVGILLYRSKNRENQNQ